MLPAVTAALGPPAGFTTCLPVPQPPGQLVRVPGKRDPLAWAPAACACPAGASGHSPVFTSELRRRASPPGGAFVQPGPALRL